MGWEASKPYIAMLFIQFVNSGLALFSKAALAKGMNPYVFIVYRQALATVVLAPFAFFLERKVSSTLSFNLLSKIFFVSLCGITLTLNLYYFSLNYTSATFASASTTAVPAISFILAVLFRMESTSIKEWHGIAKIVGSVVCILGTLVFAFVKGPPMYQSNRGKDRESFANHSSKGEWIKGSLIMLSSNAAWSLWLILQGPVVKQYPAKLRLIALQSFFSCIQCASWAVAMERKKSSWRLGWDLHLLSVVYCSVVVTGITYWLRVWVIERKGPVVVAMFTPLQLIITAIFSAFLWGETFHWGSLCGAIVSVVGLYSVLWGKHKEEKYAKKRNRYRKAKRKRNLSRSQMSNRLVASGFYRGGVGSPPVRTGGTESGPIVKQYSSRLRLLTLQTFFSCIQSALWAVAVDRKKSTWKLGWDSHLLPLVYFVVFVSGIGNWLRIWVIQKKGPVFGAMFNQLTLIITAIFWAALWRETFHWGRVCGTIMSVAGLYSVLWGKHKEEKYEGNENISERKEKDKLEHILSN